MERLTIRNSDKHVDFISPIGTTLAASDLRAATIQVLLDRLAAYEDAEEQGLLVRLPKNFRLTAAKKETGSNALVTELIKAMRPYAEDDRLFNAVDALRVFIAQQNNFLDILTREEAEAALTKEG